MECPSCTFQNTPGTRACVRCASLLDFSAVDYLPPRASGPVALRGVRHLSRRLRIGAAHDLTLTSDRLTRVFRVHPEIPWAPVLRSIIPGWGLRFTGHRFAARCVLGAWLGLLLCSAAMIGGTLATLLALTAVSLHCATVTIAVGEPLRIQPIVRRMATGLIIYITLVATVYAPGLWLLRRTVRVIPAGAMLDPKIAPPTTTLLAPGPWFRPAQWNRCDLVLYRLNSNLVGGAIFRAGEGFDRILGIPADHVRIAARRLTVNGEVRPEESLPLGGLDKTLDMDLVLGTDQYLIVPSALVWKMSGGHGAGGVSGMVSAATPRLSVVRGEDLIGRAVWQVRPWSRFGRPTADSFLKPRPARAAPHEANAP